MYTGSNPGQWGVGARSVRAARAEVNRGRSPALDPRPGGLTVDSMSPSGYGQAPPRGQEKTENEAVGKVAKLPSQSPTHREGAHCTVHPECRPGSQAWGPQRGGGPADPWQIGLFSSGWFPKALSGRTVWQGPQPTGESGRGVQQGPHPGGASGRAHSQQVVSESPGHTHCCDEAEKS